MRNLRFCILMIFLTLIVLLTGCVKGEFHITVNKDGSGEIENKLAFYSQMLALMSMSDSNPLEEMKKSYDSENYKVVTFKDGDYQGITATTHIDDITKLENLSGSAKGIDPKMGALKIEKVKGLFQDKYSVNAQLDMDDLKPDKDDTMGIQKAMFSQIDLKLTVTLPSETKDHNASRVLDDKKTYQWDLIAGQKNDIKLSYDAPNMNLVYIAAAVVVVLLVLITIIIRKRRKPKYIRRNILSLEE